MEIKLELIKPSPNPVRKSWDEEKMQELANSIKEQGVIVPIKVRPTSNSHYEIVYGHRRVEASRRAGLDVVPCNIEGVEDDDAIIEALTENIVKENMNDADKGDALRAIKELTGKTWKEIGALFGLSERRVKEFAGVSDDEADILRRADIHTLTVDHAQSSRQAGDYSIDVLKKAEKEGLSVYKTRDVAKAIKAASTPERKRELLERPYSPYEHDPMIEQERQSYIDRRKKSSAIEWEMTPDVAQILARIKKWHDEIEEFRRATQIGKAAPEAKRFIINNRLNPLVTELEDWISELRSK